MEGVKDFMESVWRFCLLLVLFIVLFAVLSLSNRLSKKYAKLQVCVNWLKRTCRFLIISLGLTAFFLIASKRLQFNDILFTPVSQDKETQIKLTSNNGSSNGLLVVPKSTKEVVFNDDVLVIPCTPEASSYEEDGGFENVAFARRGHGNHHNHGNHSNHRNAPPPHSNHSNAPPPHSNHRNAPPPHSNHSNAPPPHNNHRNAPPPHGNHSNAPRPHMVAPPHSNVIQPHSNVKPHSNVIQPHKNAIQPHKNAIQPHKNAPPIIKPPPGC